MQLLHTQPIVGSSPTITTSFLCGYGASGNTKPCQGLVAGSIPAARSNFGL